MGFHNSESEEKRDFLRMRVDSPVTMALADKEESMSGICRDLSGGGMLVEVEKALPIGTELEVTLASSYGHAPVLQAAAKVTRIIELPDSDAGRNRVGLRLTEIRA